MSDEDNMALNGNGEVAEDTTPVSEAPEEEANLKSETEPTGEVEVNEEVAETGETKKGYSQRVRELNARAKAAEEKVRSLSEQIAELTGGIQPEYQPYQPQVAPGTELTPEQYQSDVMRTADSIVTLRLKQQQSLSKINADVERAIRENPELDPDSESFDPDLSQAVTGGVRAYISSDPYNADVKGFIDNLLKPYKRSVAKEVGQVSEKLVRQVSQTASKPTSVRSPEKPAEEKSVEELEKELGVQY